MKNDASSRSHAICRIRIENPAVTGRDGLLYLIDLAGSEVARDIASHKNDRMRETREINISLSALKDCIRGKAEWDASRGSKSRLKKPHVPFRQSSLTRILKHVFDPSSERPCKTVVLACINPSLADAGASKNTLRYAELLRVLIAEPLTAGLDSSALEASGDSREGNKVVGFRKDSRHPMDSQVEAIPFKQRIRSGMVVKWSSAPRDSTGTSSSDLALVLCSTDSKTCHSEGASDETTGGDHDREKKPRYLCAKVVPGSTANAYEIRIWDQIIISDDMMEAEIILEYDTASRYYYQSK
ncbi:unnamed protein product [Parascedosporium putredinis]|uniref:Kinesin motor domain-containing protein n=1 Tax=Parascedosporium putredinis TaxID=1442378 RepID=A0A9P1MCS3_9PEZI|nr:unnamed protein product [Parascedosporium putredinis]CAI7997335.1 unnamed protein product [Parascedosporium putredinis]